MKESAAIAAKPRTAYRNIHITQIIGYRLPPAGIVSILHRVSGAVMFLLLPFVVWLFDVSLSSEISYERFTSAFGAGIGPVPGFLVKLLVLALIWAYLHHFIAGVRHLWMDATHAVTVIVRQVFGHLHAGCECLAHGGPGCEAVRLVLK